MTRQSSPAGAPAAQEAAMPVIYTLPTGETRTTCGQHRTLGYSVDMLVGWACRGCGLPQGSHETTDETVARNRAAAVSA